jgi:hypothetical protein
MLIISELSIIRISSLGMPSSFVILVVWSNSKGLTTFAGWSMDKRKCCWAGILSFIQSIFTTQGRLVLQKVNWYVIRLKIILNLIQQKQLEHALIQSDFIVRVFLFPWIFLWTRLGVRHDQYIIVVKSNTENKSRTRRCRGNFSREEIQQRTSRVSVRIMRRNILYLVTPYVFEFAPSLDFNRSKAVVGYFTL